MVFTLTRGLIHGDELKLNPVYGNIINHRKQTMTLRYLFRDTKDMANYCQKRAHELMERRSKLQKKNSRLQEIKSLTAEISVWFTIRDIIANTVFDPNLAEKLLENHDPLGTVQNGGESVEHKDK